MKVVLHTAPAGLRIYASVNGPAPAGPAPEAAMSYEALLRRAIQAYKERIERAQALLAKWEAELRDLSRRRAA